MNANFDVDFVIALEVLFLFLVKVKVFHDLIGQFGISFNAEQIISIEQIHSDALHLEMLVTLMNLLLCFDYFLRQLVDPFVNPLLDLCVLPQVDEVERRFQE
jgi:hypothetical protein